MYEYRHTRARGSRNSACVTIADALPRPSQQKSILRGRRCCRVLAALSVRARMPAEEEHYEVENCSNATHHDDHDAHSAHSTPGTVLFLFAAFAVGGEPHLLKWAHTL